MVSWGFCKCFCVASLQRTSDVRRVGLTPLILWLAAEEYNAHTCFQHYDHQGLLSSDLWRKELTLNVDCCTSRQSLLTLLRTQPRKVSAARRIIGQALPQQVSSALQRFPHAVRILLSGSDLVTDSFSEPPADDAGRTAPMQQAHYNLHDTSRGGRPFSLAGWRQRVAKPFPRWLQRLPS